MVAHHDAEAERKMLVSLLSSDEAPQPHLTAEQSEHRRVTRGDLYVTHEMISTVVPVFATLLGVISLGLFFALPTLDTSFFAAFGAFLLFALTMINSQGWTRVASIGIVGLTTLTPLIYTIGTQSLSGRLFFYGVAGGLSLACTAWAFRWYTIGLVLLSLAMSLVFGRQLQGGMMAGHQAVTISVVFFLLSSFLAVAIVLRFHNLRNQALHSRYVAIEKSTSLRDMNAQLETMIAARKTDLEKAITEQKRLSAELASQAIHDQLTGIYNRGFLEHQMADHEHTPLAVAIFDIDLFKKINENYTYFIGDRVLREVAQLLNTHARSSEQLFRYGGEEFILLMPGATLQESLGAAERLRLVIDHHKFTDIAVGLHVTVSVGVCALEVHDLAHASQPSTSQELLLRADEALRNAKDSGRNTVAAVSYTSTN